MVERTLADEIISIVHSEANNNPLPLKCTIHETYPNGLIDVMLENGTILTYLPVIGSPRVGDTGVLLYLDDEDNNQIIITNGGSSGGGGSTNVSWGNILNKPSSFPPSAHKHNLNDITDWKDPVISGSFRLKDFELIQSFTMNGAEAYVYSDDLSIYIRFTGKASEFDTNNRLLLGTLDSKYGTPSTFVYAPIANVSSGIVLGAVSRQGGVYIMNYSNLKSVTVSGGVYYPLKQRIDNPTGSNVLTSYDMTQYYTKTVIDGLLSLKSDNTNTLTNIELLDDGRINLKYIGDE